MANAEVTSTLESANEDIPLFSDIFGYNQVEEISPDLLKNTPSNIAKLEDAIEHCKAHKKYLACTKSPSDGDDVHWYFCKVPLAEKELAASVPRIEIIEKSDYFQFSKRDSLALEASFLQVGGRNTVLIDALSRCIPLVSDRPTIIFGADVTHPHPGEDSSPSIAVVVATQDWLEVTKYVGLVCLS
ncbi:hypothetical protein ZIOFF_012689 [Zingiber officinale]|uniref:Piwi domain-containing protein n=1 Tax=Zingiber officinale TaxID=94328 RepID=A0A8J5LQW9_ZINOF|nr:hypothetical protein ZIOFF_012689 [Zingiber officinale]